MQVTETLSDGLKRAFSVVVPAAEIEGKVGAKLAEIGRTIKLPGFRPGKVPVNLVRQRFGASIMAEVMQDALNQATDQMVEERGLRPAGQPKVALDGEPKIDGKQASDLAFSVEMELLPEISVPDLAALSLTRLRSEVAPDSVEKTLSRLAAQQREVLPVAEGHGAETGDVLTVDFVGSVDGVAFEGGAGQDAKIEIGGEGFIPGFSEGMAGMRPGESRDVSVTFPDAYHAAELAGKAAVFAVTAKALGRPAEQDLDDALAAKMGFESLEKLREALTAQLQRELDQMSRLRIKRELLDVLAEQAQFPAPQNLVDAEFGAIWARVEQDVASGQIDEEDRGKDTETLRAEYPGHRRPSRPAGPVAVRDRARGERASEPRRAEPGVAGGGLALPGPGNAGDRVLSKDAAGDRAAPRSALRGQGGRLHPGDGPGAGPAGLTRRAEPAPGGGAGTGKAGI